MRVDQCASATQRVGDARIRPLLHRHSHVTEVGRTVKFVRLELKVAMKMTGTLWM